MVAPIFVPIGNATADRNRRKIGAQTPTGVR
jgi:hypothetical protein